jgi:protein-tyrosine phosphatase
MGNVADKMYDGLWLGEREGVIRKTDRVLETLNIDIVITAQTQREVDAAKLQTFLGGREWHHFVLNDTDEEEIGRYFEDVHAILHAAKQAGKRVYIHCAAGISRSPTLVAAHLML